MHVRSAWVCAFVLVSLAIEPSLVFVCCARSTFLLDRGFRFSLLDGVLPCSNVNTSFPVVLDDQQCMGLTQVSSAHSADDCALACCQGFLSTTPCQVWQWCPPNSNSCSPSASCWIGLLSTCQPGAGWQSRGVELPTPPSPGSPCTQSECQSEFDDSKWRTVDVPHDFIVEGTFNPNADMSHGYLPYANAWYRRHFSVKQLVNSMHSASSLSAASISAMWLEFEGVQTTSVVYFNGVVLGNHSSGYTNALYYMNVSSVAGVGGEGGDDEGEDDEADNVIAVFVDGTKPDGWWYDGGGIYRHVSLTIVTNDDESSSSSTSSSSSSSSSSSFTAAASAASPSLYIAPYSLYLPSVVTGPIAWKTEDNDDAVVASPSADAAIYASVEICTNSPLSSSSSSDVAFVVQLDVTDSEGVLVNSSKAAGVINASHSLVRLPFSFSAASSTCVNVSLPTIELLQAKLWHVFDQLSIKPTLYTATLSLFSSSSASSIAVDTESIRIGVRSLSWSASSGFYLNGQPFKIRGMANHQDFAGVGVAVPDHLQWHRVLKLKQMGANGWRTAHNMPTAALLDAADEVGMVVWDENHRNGQETELVRLLKRDRNHACVIIWSLCNEVLCLYNNSINDARRLKEQVVRVIDPLGQRVVSANTNDWVGPSTPLDVQGFDYNTQNYDSWHAQLPNVPSISSETSSAVSDRDEYMNDGTSGHVSGYDTNYPSWGESAQQAWGGVGLPNGQGILTRAFIAGGWVWTGWDYKGEPTPYSWPDVNSHFGILDIAGFEKDRYFWYDAWFRAANADNSSTSTPPALYLFPHWNWQTTRGDDDATLRETGQQRDEASYVHGSSSSSSSSPRSDDEARFDVSSTRHRNHHGDDEPSHAHSSHLLPLPGVNSTINCWVYSNADEVELFVNGKSAGRQSMPRYAHVEWQVAYEAGTIEAVAYAKGSSTPLTTMKRTTTGVARRIVLSIKDGVGSPLYAGCGDVALVIATIVDELGQRVPTASHNVSFSVSGVGSYIGGGNGDPACLVNDKSSRRPAYHGMLLAVIQAGEEVGSIRVTAEADGLTADQLTLTTQPPDARATSSWCHQNYLV